MRTSTIIATLSAPPETVWDVVTNLQDTEWRSDLSRVEVSLDGRHFTEFSANGHSTSFSILEKTPYELSLIHICSRRPFPSISTRFPRSRERRRYSE